MQKTLHLIALPMIAGLGVAIAACGTEPAPDPGPNTSDVIFEGKADRTALVSLLAAKTLNDPLRGAATDSPLDMSILPPSPPTTFTWHVGSAMASGSRAPRAPVLLPTPAKAPSPTATGWLEALLGERRAYAGEATFTGEGYFLSFTIPTTDTPPKDFAILRVFTSTTSYTPSAAAWTKLTASGSWVTLTILSATFSADKLTAGPFLPQNVLKFCAGG